MTLARTVKVLEFTAMISQTSRLVLTAMVSQTSLFWSCTSRCHNYSSQLQYGFTADKLQPWTNYENNKHLLDETESNIKFIASGQGNIGRSEAEPNIILYGRSQLDVGRGQVQ